MDPHPGPLSAPRLGPGLGVGQVGEGLPGPEVAADVLHGPLRAACLESSTRSHRHWLDDAVHSPNQPGDSRGLTASASVTTALRLSGFCGRLRYVPQPGGPVFGSGVSGMEVLR